MPRHDPSEKTKAEILLTAVRLFSEKGWENVNVEDVVKEVGVTRGAFYHYFKSREELIIAVVDKNFSENNPFTAASKKKGLNAIEKLRFALRMNLVTNYNNDSMTRELYKAVQSPAIFKSEFISQLSTVAPSVEKLLIEGNEDGSMSVDYPKQTAQVLALLPSQWLSYELFQITYEEFVNRVLFLAQFMEKLGVPVFNDELKELAFECYKKVRKKT